MKFWQQVILILLAGAVSLVVIYLAAKWFGLT